MVTDKLRREAEAIVVEGWKWTDAAPDFPYGHTFGLRQLRGEEIPLTPEEEAARDALKAEFDQLEEQYAEADELPDEVDARLGEIETALEAFEDRPVTFDPDDIIRAGAFVSIAHDGSLRVERGFVRPEDEIVPEPE
jgi:ParB family chromosome partitioning protein